MPRFAPVGTIAGTGYDHGFKAGAESHYGPEANWDEMRRLVKAVDHRAFGFCCHIDGWSGTPEEKAQADREAAPYVLHTHIPWTITEGLLVERMNNLRNAGYQGYYSAELHTGRYEYALVGAMLGKIRAVLEDWRNGGTGDYLARPPRAGTGAPPAPGRP